MAKNNLTAEIKALIQYIKTNYQEGVDYKFVTEKESEKRGNNIMNSRERFNFPLSVNDYLDYQKGDKGGNWFVYRTHEDTSKYGGYDLMISLKEKEENTSQEKPENCEVCNKLAFKENGRMRLWDGEKDIGGPFPNVIGYFHPECAKRKTFQGWKLPNQNDIFPIKEKILRNLDKISFDQAGHFANAELLKKPYEYGDGRKREAGVYDIIIDGEEINLTLFNREEYSKEFHEIRNAIVNNIKQNISDWEIKRDEYNSEFLQNKKNGVKAWKIIFCEIVFENGKQDWAEIESLLKGQVSLPDKNKNPTSEEWENQIKEYFRNHNIHTITLDGDNLIIEHNGGKEEILEANDLQLQIIKQKLAKLENHSLSFPEFKKTPTGNNSSQSNPNNHQLAIGLAVGIIGGVVLTGIIVLLLSRRRKNK